MAVKTKQGENFNKAKILLFIQSTLIIVAAVISCLSSIFCYSVFFTGKIIMFINIIILLFVFILNYAIDGKIKNGENIRRRLLISNSFDVDISIKSIDNYYDNDELAKGYRRLLANICENSFFSKHVSKRMLYSFSSLFPIAIIACLVVYISTVGFININFSLTILQLYLSGLLLSRWIKIYRYYKCVEKLYNDALELLGLDLKEDSTQISRLLLLIIEYETNISENNLVLSEKIYNLLNSELTDEWNEIKKRLKII